MKPFFNIAPDLQYRLVAEDTVDAAKKLPRSLLISTTANKISCLVVVVLIVLTAGNVNSLFEQPLGASGHPLGAIIQLTYNAAQGSKSLACAPFGLMLPIFTMCCININTAASRMIFSFVRDDRNPFVHKIMAKVSFLRISRNSLYQVSNSAIGSAKRASATSVHYTGRNISMSASLDQFRLVSRLPSNRLAGRAVALDDLYFGDWLLALLTNLPTRSAWYEMH